MSVFCPVCSGSEVEVQGLFRGSHPTFDGLKRVLCRTCGMVFADPMPQDRDLDQYNANYFTAAHGGKHTSPTAVAGAEMIISNVYILICVLDCKLRSSRSR